MSPGNKKVSHESCIAVREVLNRVGDKWSVQVVTSLKDGPKRFSELRRGVEGISQRMLTLTVRNRGQAASPPVIDIFASGAERCINSMLIATRNACGRSITAEPGAGLSGLTGMVLTGNGQDGVRHRGGVYETSETWRGFGYPHYVIDGRVDNRSSCREVVGG